MKDTLICLIENDSTYNKSVTRYLYKTHPELWEQIVAATNFLPETALAKQRCWHIINEVYVRPTCPVTGEFLRWREKKYAPYSTMEAKNKAIGQVLRNATKGDKHWRRKNPEKSKLANEKFTNGYIGGQHKPLSQRDRDYVAFAQKTKQTCLTRYGVSNGSQSLTGRKNNSDAQIASGRATPLHLRSLRKIYYDAVWQVTKQSWKDNFDDINPQRINRSKNALDHIYSVQQGFRDNIPPYIIGHWTNLRIISLSENSAKGMRCDKSQEQLFDDFFRVLVNTA